MRAGSSRDTLGYCSVQMVGTRFLFFPMDLLRELLDVALRALVWFKKGGIWAKVGFGVGGFFQRW